ncbi:MAG: hypothetical protein AAF629_05565 [Chloroflexota bacterium]
MDLTKKLPLWLLIVPTLLVLIYSMLSFIAFTDPISFHESMTIPVPEHGFMLLSWGGKNTAIVVGLILAILSRQQLPLLIMMAVLVTMQFGDINAGTRTNVNVFVTYIGLGGVILEMILYAYWRSREQNVTSVATA